MSPFIGSFLFFLLFLGIVVLANAIRVVREYERLVVFRLGRLVGARGPGLVLLTSQLMARRWSKLTVKCLDSVAEEDGRSRGGVGTRTTMTGYAFQKRMSF